MELIHLDDYDFGNGLPQSVFALFLEGVPLVDANAYLFSKSKGNSVHSIRSRATQLKTFLSQVLTDFNDWSFLIDTRNNPSKNRYVVANKGYLKVTDQYMSAYLKTLSSGSSKFTKKPLVTSSIMQHIETIRGFYLFCHKYGFMSKKCDFSYLYDKLYQDKTATIGLDSSVYGKYYDKETFLALIGHIQTKNPFLKARNLLILKLCYFSGMRPHELVKDDNNFNIKKLKTVIKKNAPFNASADLLISGKGKGGGKLRKILIPPEVYQALKGYLYIEIPKVEKAIGSEIKGNIFVSVRGQKLKKSGNFNDVIWSDAKDAYIANNKLSLNNIKLWEQRDLYSTRHCFATNLIIQRRKEGKRFDQMVIKEIMGHSNFSTTLASYIYIAAVLMNDNEMRSMAVDMADKDKVYKNGK